jgi:hypothetical protein
MLVHEVMSTGVVTVKKTETIRSAVMKMMHRHCGSLPVVEVDNQLVGVVTLRDVLIQLYPNYGDYIHDNVHSRSFVEMEEGYPEVLGGKVEDIMSKNPMTVAPHDPILKPLHIWVSRTSGESPSSTRARLSGCSVSATSTAGYASRKECGAERGFFRGTRADGQRHAHQDHHAEPVPT